MKLDRRRWWDRGLHLILFGIVNADTLLKGSQLSRNLVESDMGFSPPPHPDTTDTTDSEITDTTDPDTTDTTDTTDPGTTDTTDPGTTDTTDPNTTDTSDPGTTDPRHHRHH